MKLIRLLIAGMTLAGLSACSDPEKDANALFVDAANEIQGAAQKGDWDKYQAYLSASDKIKKLGTDDLKTTQVSVKVASGEKIGTLSFPDLTKEIERLQASRGVCAALKTDACVTGIIVAAIPELMKTKNNRSLDTAVSLITRLQFLGKQAEADSAIVSVGQALGVPNVQKEFSGGYPDFAADLAKEIIPGRSDAETTVIYDIFLKAPALQDPLALQRFMSKFTNTLSLKTHETLISRIVKDTKDGQEQSNLAGRMLSGLYNFRENPPPTEALLSLASYVEPSKRNELLAEIASLGPEQEKAVLAQVKEPEIEAFNTALMKAGTWALSAKERLKVLQASTATAVIDSPFLVVKTAVENTDDKDAALGLLDRLSSYPTPLLQIAREQVDTGKGLEKIVPLTQVAVTSDPGGHPAVSLCENSINIVVAAKRDDLIVPLVKACEPIARLGGDSSALAQSMARTLILGATGSSDETVLDQTVAIVSQTDGWKNGLDGIMGAVVYAKKAKQVEVVANSATAARDPSQVMSRYLAFVLSVDGNATEAWDKARSTGLKSPNWWLPAEALVATSSGPSAFDKLIDARGKEVAAALVDTRSSSGAEYLPRLSAEQLLKLSKVAEDPKVEAELLNALAAKVTKDSKPELVAAAWQLPDDDAAAALRVSMLLINDRLAELSRATQ
ncbi:MULTISPECIES: hypothetical protein [unclassified Rhizobium]|uniref:hypothetical protein n=1 Tax=unclassified Rhizobium TaxID=2613769 RepID=UPI001AD97147|nr:MULTISPECIES: hypothetical protein [unclassified Rhizobium]MBO9127921.1 hypothetical protein [Rhizobium sp. 16-488-2b]MBO9178498.1 hypothetical protein [Rhizobium sp. 16-488-2a]